MAVKPNKLEKLDISVDDVKGVVCATVKLKPRHRTEARVKYTAYQVRAWLLERGIVTKGIIAGGNISNQNHVDLVRTFVFEIDKKPTEQTTTAILEREEKKKTNRSSKKKDS